MALIVPEESQRPYRFGMTLVCIGALFNWLGLADHQTKEPKAVPAVRYIGVGLVASGAVLICMAMCFWMNSVRDDEDDESIDHIHVISLEPPVRMDEKPPDYASVVDLPPPSYDDAIKLDPQRLITSTDTGGDGGHRSQIVSVADTCAITIDESCDKVSSVAAAVPTTGDAVDGSAAAAAAAAVATQQTSTSTSLAQAIRKSIRDIRKQLTNTVSDADAEHIPQPHAQTGCSATHSNSVVVVSPSARNKTTSNAHAEYTPTE